jgi:hypothetical protein
MVIMKADNTSRKTLLFTRLLPTLKEQSAYFSIAAVKRALVEAEIELADDTLREYMSKAMRAGIVNDAGRGWYSRHQQPVTLDPKPVVKIIREVKKVFPLLEFCCWSTLQLNPFAQHLIAQPTILLYAESDALDAIADALKAAGWDAWANPGKADVERFVRPSEKTVVLRPAKSRQPEAQEHLASIEQAPRRNDHPGKAPQQQAALPPDRQGKASPGRGGGVGLTKYHQAGRPCRYATEVCRRCKSVFSVIVCR